MLKREKKLFFDFSKDLFLIYSKAIRDRLKKKRFRIKLKNNWLICL